MTEGGEYMRLYRLIGLDHRTLSYDDFVSLWLTVESAQQAANFNAAVAGAIANGKGRVPDSWITAAIPTDSLKRSEWRNWDVFRLMDGI